MGKVQPGVNKDARRPLIESLEGRTLMAAGPVVTGFTLVNARTDADVGPLVGGQTIYLGTVGTQLSVRAAVAGATAKSVKFTLDGKQLQVENAAPYTIKGDVDGDYLPWTPVVGSHTLVVTAYTAAGATGTAGPSATLKFAVKAEAAPTPTPTPA